MTEWQTRLPKLRRGLHGSRRRAIFVAQPNTKTPWIFCKLPNGATPAVNTSTARSNPKNSKRFSKRAVSPPTGANRQPQRLIVVQSAEGMERLARCTRDFKAPCAIIVCADTDEVWTRKYDGKKIGDIDASIVTDHMMLAAASLGLDSLWICMFKPEAVREEFALPPHVEPVNILLIGYGAGEPASPERHAETRKPLSATVFHESYGKE